LGPPRAFASAFMSLISTRDDFDAVFADCFRVAIILAASSVSIWSGLQTLYVRVSGQVFANERGLNAQKIASTVQRAHRAGVLNQCTDFDALHNFFALDSSVNLLHSEITSKTSSAAGVTKLMFACRPRCRYCNSPDPVVLHSNLSPRHLACDGSVLFRHALPQLMR